MVIENKYCLKPQSTIILKSVAICVAHLEHE